MIKDPVRLSELEFFVLTVAALLVFYLAAEDSL